MHELGIAADILEIALAEAKKHGGGRITRVNLEVGVLRGIVPENLVFLFGHVSKGTIAEGALLAVEEQPALIECGSCGPTEARGFALGCPVCGNPTVRIDKGDSLRILSMEMDD